MGAQNHFALNTLSANGYQVVDMHLFAEYGSVIFGIQITAPNYFLTRHKHYFIFLHNNILQMCSYVMKDDHQKITKMLLILECTLRS